VLPPIEPPGPPPVSPMRVPLASISADTVLGDNHGYVLARDAAALTLTLPRSVPANEGRIFVVRNINVGTLTLRTELRSRNTIDDRASLEIASGRTATVVADGAGRWYDVGGGVADGPRLRRPT
jgi:hypothetical protein